MLAELSPAALTYLRYEWPLWARPTQLPPPGDWRVWLLLAGRGFGKTRAGAEWIRALAGQGIGRQMGLVGETFDDVRHVMVEGPAGVLAVSRPTERPQWTPSQRQLVWMNGARARCFSADDPEQLRGPEFDFAWADEIAKWRYPAAWDNLMLALRIGAAPQCLATTTPRSIPWLRQLASAHDTCLATGKTADNAVNLAPGFVAAMQQRYGGTPLATQELDGRFLNDDADALWTRDMVQQCRATPPTRAFLTRILIGVDPAIGGPGETGIIVAGKDRSGHFWVLEDGSCAGHSDHWVRRVHHLAAKWRAEAVIAEVNQGGDLVRSMLHQAGRQLTVRCVRAVRAKAVRAEPVAAAYARQQISHAGMFSELEAQMCGCVPGRVQTPSPDRLDALVWVMNALLSGAETISREINI